MYEGQSREFVYEYKGLKAGLDTRIFQKKSTLPRRAECWKVSREEDNWHWKSNKRENLGNEKTQN